MDERLAPIKDILRLRKEFGHLLKTPRLSSDEIAAALQPFGHITIVSYSKRLPRAYRETADFMNLGKTMREFVVMHAITTYLTKLRIPFEPLDP